MDRKIIAVAVAITAFIVAAVMIYINRPTSEPRPPRPFTQCTPTMKESCFPCDPNKGFQIT